ncbi:membrane protein [Spirochaetia bacterium]|nr:membrane protein [Spirochaetia bacterium]
MKLHALKIWFVPVLLITVGVFVLPAQEIVTAERYLELVSDRYSTIRDYEARLAIRSGTTNMYGTLSYLTPAFLRIDFTTPSGQVVVFDGELLTVYLPEYKAILGQGVTNAGRRSGVSQGLVLLRRNYIPTFVTGPDPVPLEAGSGERVVKLRLTRRSVAEGFRELILSIDPGSKLIRRIEGRTIAEVQVQFDFSQVAINQGIPERRFLYDAPATANLYNNFLFRDDD